MTDIIARIKESLANFYPESEIRGFIRIILEEVFNQHYPLIVADKSKKITAEQLTKIEKILDRLRKYEPIQYIVGKTEFFGLPFFVDENVLIPRPETEELVELIIRQNERENLSVLDIGTGSGCIAVSLAKLVKGVDVYGWDISEKALEVAERNMKNNEVDVTFQQVNILNKYPVNKEFDVIVSNPPYVLESDKQSMEKNVLEHEPHLALFVPDDKALLFYERIADVAKVLLKPEGKLYFEIHHLKGTHTVKMLHSKGFRTVELYKDLSGCDRMVYATLDNKK